MTKFCWCGRVLVNKWGKVFCRVHREHYKEAQGRKKIGKYSGKSKRPYGKYEEY